MESSLSMIKLIADSGDLSRAVEELSRLISIEPENDEAYFMRGKLRWRLGDRSGATADYAHAAELNPKSGAVRALEMARDIEGFFNPDLLNP